MGAEHHHISATGLGIAVNTTYFSTEAAGVTIVVVAAGLSLLCAMIMLGILGLSMWRTRTAPSEHFFVRTHAAAFFTSLVFADVIQAIGSMINIKWISHGGITLDHLCSTQGAIKNAGNLAVSVWTLMLAVHTFWVLFLRIKPKDLGLYASLLGLWPLIGLLVIIGPAAIQKENKGPYYGISGSWCWISDPYPVARIMLEYAWMFTAAIASFILYTLTFLRLRGNIEIEGGKMTIRRVHSADAWQYQVTRNSVDIRMTAVAKGLLGFPILFTVIILPIAVCRFIDWSGEPVPFEATIFADSVFSLMGVFHLILFITTRSLFPREEISLFSPSAKVSDEVREYGFQPYIVQDFASAHGFSGPHQQEAEKGMVSLPPRTNASMNRLETTRNFGLDEEKRSPMSSVPEDEGPDVQIHRSMTTRTVGSVYSEEGDARLSRNTDYAWDDVDLEQAASEMSTSPHNDGFASHQNPRDTRFTVSAYTYDEPEEVPPLPSGAGIGLGAGRDYSDEEDGRHSTHSNQSLAHPRRI